MIYLESHSICLEKVRIMKHEILPNFLKNRAYLTPNREAIVYKSDRLTFSQLYEKAYFTAGVLTTKGITKEDYVSFLVKSDLQTVIAFLAIHIIGAKIVPLNNKLTAKEIIFQLQDAGSHYIITDDIFAEKTNEIQTALNELTILKKEDIPSFSYQKPEEQTQVSLSSINTIMYTSGTTGNPKGVIQTYGNHWWSSIGNALNIGLHENDVWLCAVPLFHISGYSILMRSLVYGIKVILHDSFDVCKVLQDMKKEQVTIMSVVTTMLDQIEKQTVSPFPSSFRCMLLGGGPAPKELINRCLEKGIPVYYSYGMTETSSQIVSLSPEDCTRKIGSAGKPLFPSQLKIINEMNQEVENNIAGEIVVTGPNVSSGYLNKGPHSLDSWFHTGDIGYKDSEGYLYVLDRRTDLIISGGENIYPAEIESILTTLPGIKEAGVIGISHNKWGQVPVAFVVKEKNACLSEEWILEQCQGKLAKYKIPTMVYFIEELPRNASGKILRRDLRKTIC